MHSFQRWIATGLALHNAVFGEVEAFPGRHNHGEVQISYDFVIVGGGAAGLALAVRLSEIDSQNVLVLEAGQFPEIVKAYTTPGAGQGVLGTDLDWGFATPPQESLGNRSITYHRGRGVGGSTLINGLTYGRGSSSVYDLWQDLGNNGWDWNSVLPYFEKSTSFVPVDVADYQTYNASAYSDNGPIALSYPTYVYDSSTAFIEALGSVNVSIVIDLNLGDNIGAKQEPLTLDAQQQRVSSYDGYYKPVRTRPNLTVRPLSQVQQVILEMRDGALVATGVVYADMVFGTTVNVTASKEVILSAGVFQTPQLLILSGIGPQETLQNYGIPQHLVNENVGRHMQDHFYFSVIARAQTNSSASQVYNRVDLVQAAQQEYSVNRSGPLTTPIGPTYGFRQLSTEELHSLGAAEALANQTAQAQIEYLWEDVYYPAVPSMGLPQYPNWKNESFISVTAALLSPVSRGNVTLQTNSIQDAPAININYLESTVDQQIALFMFRSLRTVLSQPALSQYTVGPDHGEVVPGVDVEDDATILEYIKSTLQPVWHAAGTCRMLPRNEGGVVDERLRVHGVDGLRVIDASIFPVIPDNHIQGPVYMVAEKAADMIKEDYNLN
ncbi:hypothetical protein LTR56_013032 [Elasticomyces elasticus]|nr:hypothetical protein LTR22_021975 [Elasticomyces elasticus]KAK3638560.1 hypothetical protein LTR56_013032 [Elasticomyces elasticus]KAK4928150.1 hypothetical protein LTR49_005088 [Elasticomyces elasticus]KAK5765902.1 hypothetical protein LTS12_003909 [Elasticomyces elasticus]